ncbi:MAG: hypothetical protein II689_05030 [Firmicutes bacterium]|nr:hypothetical protein [Bacillota bacterium]
MNSLVLAGIGLGALVTVVELYLYQLPNWLSTALYIVAMALIIVGMVRRERDRRYQPGENVPSGNLFPKTRKKR